MLGIRLKITLVASLLLGAAAVAVTLRGSPIAVARVSTTALVPIGEVRQPIAACQMGEVLPRETSAIRMRIYAVYGPRVVATVLEDGRVLAHGERGSGWSGGAATVSVRPLPTTRSDVELCFAIYGNAEEPERLVGEPTTPSRAAFDRDGPMAGRLRAEYLRPSKSSWWSLAPEVARRMGLGRAASGTWWALLAIVLVGGMIALCSWEIVRGFEMSRARTRTGPAHRWATGRALGFGALRRVPAAAWLCSAVACLSAATWSVVSPPFEVADEPEHVAYVVQLAAGRLPSSTGEFSPEEAVALEDTHLQEVAEEPEDQTISTTAQQEKLERDLQQVKSMPENGGDYAGVAASEPPLYYALEVIPFSLGADGTLLARIQLMRLLSALMGGVTALFTFLFIREALPRVGWAWGVGGLGAALVPLFGLTSGAVTPDSMLFTVSAALFFLLARGFRRGLTRARALTLGAVIAVGLMTKLNFIGVAPGALLGLAVLSVRAARTLGRAAYVSLAMAVALALSPAVVYVAGHLATGASAFGIVSAAYSATPRSLPSELSYIWQMYLPRLPGMRDDFPGLFTPLQFWFNGYVGLLGWLDTTFPAWVYQVALVPAGLIAGLCIRGAIVCRATLRPQLAELAVYCAIAAGLMLLVGADSYITFPKTGAEYAQFRYMLPLIPLLGAVLALAARGAGERWGPVVGALIVMLFLGHDLFSQLQEIARYYG
jgi:hypothetical protein